ncbi:recombinase RecR [Candidatus Liberibacter solanacearum]|uniref:Recombination protein RecR n=1 Tax=Candidatus Liberibacter solanacearum TaxID=556287 RepID=A0A095BGL6_9HYPH|nr:recombination mediator RecR [Candidatus Liberibacter solanacearum]KGB27943.1 recombinase RecR [Candidatus Liberibacter solanacearum]KJZ80940.1 recombinase RecR [Candidatus Liberibacter solanacearum]KJZ82098.1 Recombination protein RecR [Candidatus Liberibacter solanacearum]KQC49489.1 recombination protein RecR [Candidatus Liberibacter solanacearum]
MKKKTTGIEIENLIKMLARIPGFGPRSARRATLHLVKKKEQLLGPLADTMADIYKKVCLCSICGNIDTIDPCIICIDEQRDSSVIVVIEDVADLWALERAGAVNALYHVLGGTLSPLDSIGPEDIGIQSLIERIKVKKIRELILAISATIEGQTTAHYIMDKLKNMNIKITRLAYGIPIGSELDYLDEGTLFEAIRSRTVL